MKLKHPWTKERLEALSHKALNTVFDNATKSSDPEAAAVLDIFEQHHLLERLGGGYKKSHPLIHKMELFCRSPEGVRAAILAAEAGEAPMAGVDPYLCDLLGPNYGQRDSTGWAGTFVAEEMEAAGWTRQGRKALPSSCVAKTAAFFISGDAK